MQQSQLRPASSFAHNYGAKCVAYGPPGTGKTPIVQTAPRPVLCVVEPGMLSMRRATNVPAWEAHTVPKIKEFFDWLKKSNEAKNFDTVCVDSISQMAEVILEDKLKRIAHGMKAYGEMAREVMDILSDLFYMPQKHMYLIAKQGIEEVGAGKRYRPFFPGQDLNTRVPHLFDIIMRCERVRLPETNGAEVVAFRTKESPDAMARDRSGLLNEFEPPNLAAIFAKVMAA